MRRRSCTRARTSHHGKKETGTLLKMTAAFPSRIGFSHLQSWRNRWNCDRFIKKDRRLFEPPLLPILAPATVQNLNKVIERIRLPNRVLKPEQLSAASGMDMLPLTPLLGAECLPKCTRVCARGPNAKLESRQTHSSSDISAAAEADSAQGPTSPSRPHWNRSHRNQREETTGSHWETDGRCRCVARCSGYFRPSACVRTSCRARR